MAEQGTPELIAAHRADGLSDEATSQIAQAAPNDARLQALGMKLVRDGKSIALAQNTMRAVQTLASGRKRCKWHGGLSTGPHTPVGKARCARNLPRARKP